MTWLVCSTHMKTIGLKISGVNIGTYDLGSITSVDYHDIEFRKCVLLLTPQIGGGISIPLLLQCQEPFTQILE